MLIQIIVRFPNYIIFFPTKCFLLHSPIILEEIILTYISSIHFPLHHCLTVRRPRVQECQSHPCIIALLCAVHECKSVSLTLLVFARSVSVQQVSATGRSAAHYTAREVRCFQDTALPGRPRYSGQTNP